MATNTHCSVQFSIIINKIDIRINPMFHTMLYILRILLLTEIACKLLNTHLHTNLLN